MFFNNNNNQNVKSKTGPFCQKNVTQYDLNGVLFRDVQDMEFNIFKYPKSLILKKPCFAQWLLDIKTPFKTIYLLNTQNP